MSSIYNTISSVPYIAVPLCSSTIEQVINAINSLTEKVIQSTANKIEAFPESYPRTMNTLEPILISLFKFSNQFPLLSTYLLGTVITITVIAQVILIASVGLLFLSITTPIAVLTFLHTIGSIPATIVLCCGVPTELKHRYFNQSDEINRLSAAFFNIDSESVVKLNAWSEEQRITGDTNWRPIRRKLIEMFQSPSVSLDLDSYELNSLPDIFNAPVFRKLQYLSLRNNQLTMLPPSIRNLQSLVRLNLSRNATLNYLPEPLLDLPSSCTVDINNCNFSETDIAIVRSIINDFNYQGPQIDYSIVRSNPTQSFFRNINELIDLLRTHTSSRFLQSPPIEQSLRNLYNISNVPYRELSNLRELPELSQWINRLFDTADFRGQLRQIFANKIVNYLERANQDASYRDIFAATISDSMNTCGDRMTLSVLKLGVTYQLAILEPNDIRRLHYLLTKGTWALDLLHGIARQKLEITPFVDEIEVYLGYPVKLKRALDLPIDVADMFYFQFSALTDEDLEIAKNFVTTTLANEEEHTEFLIDQPQWLEALNLNYQREYTFIRQKKQLAADTSSGNESEIYSIYRQDLKNLTKQVLQSFNL